MMLTRRDFVKSAGLAGASLLLPIGGFEAFAATMAFDSSMLEKYVDALPRPGTFRPVGRVRGVARYQVTMRELSAKLHRDLPAARLWGYDGSFPGPSFDVQSGVPIDVEWINDLPSQHFLPVDTSLPGAPTEGQSSARAVVHLHGGHVAPQSDGHPESFFEPGQRVLYRYANQQRPATLWYHDHALAVTRLNVYAGLAGFYLLRGGRERQLRLPTGRYELPIVIQDRALKGDGSLDYPSGAMAGGMPSIVEMFFGDVAVVNGKAWPRADVEPHVYRLRLLNGSNARTYGLSFVDRATGGAGPSFTQIGSDGGLLPKPWQTPRLVLAPGERADVLVDLRSFGGKALRLHNDVLPPGGMGMPGMEPPALPDIMLFQVESAPCGRSFVVPSALSAVPKLRQMRHTRVRDITLDLVKDAQDRSRLLIGGKGFADPATEMPQLGSTEIWRLINLTMDMHPMHLHLVQFQVLDRTPFDMDRYMADMAGGMAMAVDHYFTGPTRDPEPGETGWNDTVRAEPAEVTRIIARFTGYVGRYVWHCHILEHEDYDMSRPLEVVRAHMTGPMQMGGGMADGMHG